MGYTTATWTMQRLLIEDQMLFCPCNYAQLFTVDDVTLCLQDFL